MTQRSLQATFQSSFQKLTQSVTRVVSYSIDTKGNRPIPSALLIETVGPTFLYEIIRLIHKAVERQTEERGGFVHVPDVQALLREHLIAAHRFLAQPENKPLWDCYASQDIAQAVRNRNIEYLQAKREEFRIKVQQLAGVRYPGSEFIDPNKEPYGVDILVQFSATSGLAWALLLDAALLNERLVEDMRRTASTKGVPQLKLDGYHEFCLPHPAQHHRELFNLYVKSRWPIHVFTLDPMTDDQNIDDQLKQTREMQLTLTLAYVWGKIGTRSYTNATRKLSAEYQTIAINRTQVGFTHGENVFGWRFYPRFQSPDTQSNLTVFVRDTLIGGPNRNALLRQRRLEPGPRECTAIVLMPSFVPNATLDVTTNWFGLANPKHKVFDHTQAMKLSRTIQAIRVNGGGVKDESCYRAGDLRLLQNRAEQLSARLPFQSMTFQVPALNTLGGFELFGNSTTDLAPELYGWYGAPGIEPGCELFLVGDHFSVNHTRVMIGNYAVPMNQIRMLSRQVMSVRVPDNILLASESAADGDGHVDIHIATPYGVSRDLKILLAKKKVSIGKKEDTKKEETKKEDTKKPSAIVHELAPSPKSTAIVANPN